jgi:hypothetical protein
MHDYLVSQNKVVEFDNQVFLLTLESGTKGVFKPCLNDEDLADFYAEVAAFKACNFMRFDFVPPTVMRNINGLTGSFQLFIETKDDALVPGAFSFALQQTDPADLANLKIFYFVFGQWDTGPHNILIDVKNNHTHLIAIDNSGICNRQHVRYGELPFVQLYYNEKFNTDDSDKPFPFDGVQRLQKPTEQELNLRFKGCVPPTLCKRLARKNALHYVLYQNSLWVQFHAEDDGFVKSFTDCYPLATIQHLKELNLEVLKDQIFDHAVGTHLLEENFLNAILDRRDQILFHYEALHRVIKNNNNN